MGTDWRDTMARRCGKSFSRPRLRCTGGVGRQEAYQGIREWGCMRGEGNGGKGSLLPMSEGQEEARVGMREGWDEGELERARVRMAES